MTDFPELMTGHTGSAERRIRARHRMRGLAYVELGENNGGIVLNIGEGGFAVRAAEPISEEGLSCLRFRMPHASQPLEMSGKTAWTSDSRKEAGVQFINLRDDALLEIRAWIFQEVSPENFPRHSRVAHHSRKEMPRRNESILDELLSDESAQAETPDDGDDSTAGRSVIPSPKSTVPDPKTPKAMTPERAVRCHALCRGIKHFAQCSIARDFFTGNQEIGSCVAGASPGESRRQLDRF